jgi:small subunit ribosomal protein S6
VSAVSADNQPAPRAYELMVIIESSLDDDVISEQVTKIADLLTKRGSEIRSEDRWGKRRLAYEIDHKQEGYYVVFQLVGGEKLEELDRALRLDDNVVRHKLFRLPKREANRRGLLTPTKV